MKSVLRLRALLGVGLGLGALAGVGCVDSFDGSKIEMLLAGGVHVPGDSDPGNGRPPSDTHYEIFVVKDNAAFKVFEFEIKPVITRSDPCFIEDAESRFPGLHATRYAEKLREVELAEGIPDEHEAGDIYLADVRMATLDDLELRVKVLTSHESGLTVQEIADAYAAAMVPAADLTDDASNRQRLDACRAVFADHPKMYVGNDKVFSLPLNGVFLGPVDGTDPRNNAYIGGAFFDVDAVLDDFDALRINWQFNDPQTDPRIGDPSQGLYPPSDIGYHYMAGTPIQRTRGVINVPMRHRDFASISGELAIFADLATDDVQF